MLWLLGRQCVAWPTSSQPASSTQAGRQPRQPRCVSQQQPARVLSRLVCSSCNNRRRGGPCNNKGAVSQQQALASSRPSVRSSHRNQVSLDLPYRRVSSRSQHSMLVMLLLRLWSCLMKRAPWTA